MSRAITGRSKGHTVTLPGGFEPGRIYELAYRATNLPVAGAGLAAFRDTASWIKHRPSAARAGSTPTRGDRRRAAGSSGRSCTTGSTPTRKGGRCSTA